jgi:hypothetical protein
MGRPFHFQWTQPARQRAEAVVLPTGKAGSFFLMQKQKGLMSWNRHLFAIGLKHAIGTIPTLTMKHKK